MIDREKIRTVVLDLPPMTFEWLAGFHQAEGSFYLDRWYKNLPYLKWDIAQCNPELIHRVRDLIGLGVLTHQTQNTQYKEGLELDHLRVNGKEGVLKVAALIGPYLIGNKREQLNNTLTEAGCSPIEEWKGLTWDFITGFYEGDGNLHLDTDRQHVVFAQKDDTILYQLRDFFGKGVICKGGRTTLNLRVSDSKRLGLPICKSLLEHAQIYERRTRLAYVLEINGHLE